MDSSWNSKDFLRKIETPAELGGEEARSEKKGEFFRLQMIEQQKCKIEKSLRTVSKFPMRRNYGGEIMICLGLF